MTNVLIQGSSPKYRENYVRKANPKGPTMRLKFNRNFNMGLEYRVKKKEGEGVTQIN